MSTGNNIKTIRVLKNLTQKYVATELGISEKWLGEIENEKVVISNEYLDKLSLTFNMSKEEIKYFHEKPIFNNNGNNSILGHNNSYSNESVERVENLYKKIIEEKEKTINTLLKIIDDFKIK